MIDVVGRVLVCVDGYRWNTEEDSLEENSEEFTYYDPFVREPALFRKFAEIEYGDREAVFDFTNRFGLLETYRPIPLGEELATSRPKRKRNASSRSYCATFFDLASDMQFNLDMLDQEDSRIAVAVANCQPRRFYGGIQVDEHAVAIVCGNLYDCIYLQYAASFFSGSQFRRCEFCGQWFMVGEKRAKCRTPGRSTRQFCTSNCRVKSYLRRRKKAQELREAGATLRAIAKEVETDLETLKKWLGEGK